MIPVPPPSEPATKTRRPLPAVVWPLVALAAILVVDGFISPSFFSIRLVEGRLYGSLIDIVYRGTPIALLALGMAIVIGAKGIDLSVGSVVAIAGAVMAHFIHLGFDPAVVVAATLAVGLLCGLWNGFLVAVLSIQPIIATLILMVAGRGIALMINGGRIPTFRSDFFSALSTGRIWVIPSRLFLVALVFLVLWAVLRRTAFGLFVEAVGGNASAARLAGIGTRMVTLATYGISGVCAALAGIIITGDTRSSDAVTAGMWSELDAILAVVLGGASLNGGRIFLATTLVGVLIIQSLTTSILMSGLPPEFNLVVKAVVILAVLLVQAPKVRTAVGSLVAAFRPRRTER
ncbi:ABC transporter permease [Siculibacillus lacustris]|uniref:ABC transporter permease n=1 Tax=Siculibacillus lacustris TaxID=1549641 RepID=A0A4V2KTU6_9HYPH|nr:ABC transporter permease [Siculibacillus lacustris]TBW38750.1 ABC transporter permease [Siculibacillus lacustris]